MLPLQLVKTPHKILSMNLTIKFKQFLSNAYFFITGFLICRSLIMGISRGEVLYLITYI